MPTKSQATRDGEQARYELKLKLLALANDWRVLGDREAEIAVLLKIIVREINSVQFDEIAAVFRGGQPVGSREEIVDKLAHEFTAQLIKEIGKDGIKTVARENAKRGDETCASHDLCDANMPMLEAFKLVLGREPLQLSEYGSQAANADVALWNDAWDKAKQGWPT